MNVEIIIQNGNTLLTPCVEEGVAWDTERVGTPGKLTFSVIPDSKCVFQEGNPVRMTVNGKPVFYGFVFAKKRSHENKIDVTAYDQLRYLKNSDTYTYKNKRADQVIRMLAADFRLQTGTIENTGYVIPSRVEDNKTLFDIIQNALDITLRNRKILYTLYDDFGKLTLKNVENMKIPLLISPETGESFDYSSSIDGDTYNKIKLSFDNEKTGKRDIYIAKDSQNINQWGVLQYRDELQEKENGQAKADALLQLYNKPTRSLSVKGAFGDVRVRAGSSVVVQFSFDDLKLQNWMLVEKVKHTFSGQEHSMDLTLRGGEFNG